MATVPRVGNVEIGPTTTGYPLFKPDHLRAVDRVIDYFGDRGVPAKAFVGSTRTRARKRGWPA